jgi:hypothetical protein
MGHLVEQLVLLAKALDSDYEGLQPQVESVPARKLIGQEHATPTRSGSKSGLKSGRPKSAERPVTTTVPARLKMLTNEDVRPVDSKGYR